MFKKHSITLGRVYDTIRIREGGETLSLHVNADPFRMVAGIAQAQKKLAAINEKTTDQERDEIARFFAGVIFGEDQAGKLFDFYFGDPACVISVCGNYFAARLSKLITKAQKRKK